MTNEQKTRRREARKAGSTAIESIQLAVKHQREADSWADIAVRLRAKHGVEDETAISTDERSQYETKLAHAYENRAADAAKRAAYWAAASLR